MPWEEYTFVGNNESMNYHPLRLYLTDPQGNEIDVVNGLTWGDSQTFTPDPQVDYSYTLKYVCTSHPWMNGTVNIVCVGEGTLIETDGGEVRIEDLTPSHTIGGQYVRNVTKQYVNTTADAQRMVQISRDALNPGVPNRDILLTDYHMVYHPKYNNNRGVQASQMVDNDAIRYVAYTGHVYNILFDKYRRVRGHNTTLGTLPPAHEKRWEASLVFGPGSL